MFDVRVVPAWSSRNSGEIGGVELFGVIFSEFLANFHPYPELMGRSNWAIWMERKHLNPMRVKF